MHFIVHLSDILVINLLHQYTQVLKSPSLSLKAVEIIKKAIKKDSECNTNSTAGLLDV